MLCFFGIVAAVWAFETSLVVHHTNATKDSVLRDWSCAIYEENLSDLFGFPDPAPFGVFAVSESMPLNDECTGKCNGEPWVFIGNRTSGAGVMHKTMANVFTAFCVTKGNACLRGIRTAHFSSMPSSCAVSAHTTAYGANVVVDVVVKEGTKGNGIDGFKGFEMVVNRGLSDTFSCQQAMQDECTIIKGTCGGWHVAHNARPAKGECSDKCAATEETCDSFVCQEIDGQCMVYDRLLTSAGKPDSCDIENEALDCSLPDALQGVDPIIKWTSTAEFGNVDTCCAVDTSSKTPASSPGSATTANSASSLVASFAMLAVASLLNH